MDVPINKYLLSLISNNMSGQLVPTHPPDFLFFPFARETRPMDQPEEALKSTISDVDCINKGTVQAYVAYTITTQKPGGQMAVAVRRFSDFEWLQTALETEFKDVLIPPIPSKDALGRFTKGVVQYRRREFNRFLDRIIHHETLSQSKNVHAFLHLSEGEFQKFVDPEKPAAEKASSFFSNFVSTVSAVATSLTVDVIEIDPWFSAQEQYLTTLEEELTALKAGTNANTRVKSELVGTLRALADGCCEVEKFEGINDQKSTSLYFGKMSEICQAIADLDETVVKNETEFFEDAVTDKLRLTVAAKRLLDNRSKLLGEYQEAAKAADPEAKTREQQKKQELDDLSVNVRTQIEGFKAAKSHEMRFALRELVRENIEHGEQMVALWKDMSKHLDQTELQ